MTENQYVINLNTAPFSVFETINSADDKAIGTTGYIGVAYFWAHEYRYPMRSASIYQRRQIHGAMIEKGLVPCGESDEHKRIINNAMKTNI